MSEEGDVSLSALSLGTREKLSLLLNPEKVLPSEHNVPRDWRGLAHFVSVPGELHSYFRNCDDPTNKIIECWILKKDNTSTIENLKEYLQKLDRYDIVDELNEYLVKDVAAFRSKESSKVIIPIEPNKQELLTYDDVLVYPQVQKYHAYLLYADEDNEFADMVLSKLKNNGFKVCTHIDLLAGFNTLHVPVTKLFEERCQKVIVIISPEFLKSPANTWYTYYAQAIGIESQQIKILPLIYRQCPLPGLLKDVSKLFYNETESLRSYNFWDRLILNLEAQCNIPRLPVKERPVQVAIENRSLLIDGRRTEPTCQTIPPDESTIPDSNNTQDHRSLSTVNSCDKKEKKGFFSKIKVLSKINKGKKKIILTE